MTAIMRQEATSKNRPFEPIYFIPLSKASGNIREIWTSIAKREPYPKQQAEGVSFYKISKILEKDTPQSCMEVVWAILLLILR